jgi:hypothetical protein
VSDEDLQGRADQLDAEAHGHKRVGSYTASSADQRLNFHEESGVGLFVLCSEALRVTDRNVNDDIPAATGNAIELTFDDGVAHSFPSR